MIKLPEEIIDNPAAAILRLEKRTDKFAIYKRYNQKFPDKLTSYEVIKIGILPAGHKWANGTVNPEDKEFYPGQSAWGKSGWTFRNKEVAYNKYYMLVSGNKEPEEEKEIKIPEGKFTRKEFAELNNINYMEAIAWTDEYCVPIGTRANPRGKPSTLYVIK